MLVGKGTLPMRVFPCLASAALVAAMFAAPTVTGAGESCTEDAMIVFDGSGSMAEIGYNAIGVPRISEARTAMRRVIPSIATVRRLGLVIYGPSGDRTCENTDLRFSPQWQAGPRIIADVDALRPAGGTSLTESVRRAAETLDYTRQPGTVVLVTDGKETCGGAPCLLADEIAAVAPGLTVHVIGFKVRSDHFDWAKPDDPGVTTVARCLADRTGGRYVSAETVDQLIGALRTTLGCNVLGALEARSEHKLR
ncbi:vWA domain-containing protein [Antarctobacter sp.]|uniref:vWA domain-containing protein n=1 Tax=Antarctobacter sp. TaxID=1872577 RepID=UPI003A8DAE54